MESNTDQTHADESSMNELADYLRWCENYRKPNVLQRGVVEVNEHGRAVFYQFVGTTPKNNETHKKNGQNF